MASTRRYGDGSLQRRGGRWVYRVFDRETGKQRSYSGASKEAALAGPARTTNARARQASPDTTVADYLTDWVDARRQTVKASTWRKYDSVARCHLIPALGAMRLRDVKAATLTKLYADAAKRGLGPAMVRHVHVVLGSALQAAVGQGLLDANPSRTVAAPRGSDAERPTLDEREAKALLEAAAGDPYEALYWMAVTTGMREAELLALNWNDVDLSRGTVTIKGSVTRKLGGGNVVSSPKTRAGRRTITLIPHVVDLLRASNLVGAGEVRLVFPAPHGGLWTVTNFYKRQFVPLRDRAGLPATVHFHDLRHTAVTHMLESGVPAHVVARIVGHASVAVTLGRYGHVSPRMDDAAVAAMATRYAG